MNFKLPLWQYDAAAIAPSTYTVDIIANGNITQSGNITVDSTTCANGYKILCTSQTDGTQNGVWIAAAGAWTRDTNFDAGSEWKAGQQFYVQRGATNKGKMSQYHPEYDANFNVLQPVIGTTVLRITKTNTAGLTQNGVTYDYIGKVNALLSTTTKIALQIPVVRELSQAKNLTLTGKFSGFTGATNRVTISLLQLVQVQGYLHTVRPVKDSDAVHYSVASGEVISGFIDGVAITPGSTVTISPAGTPANPVGFALQLPQLKDSHYIIQIECFDTTVGTDTAFSMESEGWICGDYV